MHVLHAHIDQLRASCRTAQTSSASRLAARRPTLRNLQPKSGNLGVGCGNRSHDASWAVSSRWLAGTEVQRRQSTAAHAQQNQQPAAADNEPEKPNYSEGVFVLRLVFLSFTGAAVVKYGELLLGNIPFSHNLGLALTMILGPCIIYCFVLAARSRS